MIRYLPASCILRSYRHNECPTYVHSPTLSRNILSVRCIRPRGRRQLRLPFIAVTQQLFLVIQQLLSRFSRILRVRPLDNRINRTALLAHPTVNAFCHVDIVSCGASAAVLALFSLNSDGRGGTDSFAEFAGNAAFFAGRIATEGVLATEAGGDGPFLVGVVYCVAVKM